MSVLIKNYVEARAPNPIFTGRFPDPIFDRGCIPIFDERIFSPGKKLRKRRSKIAERLEREREIEKIM